MDQSRVNAKDPEASIRIRMGNNKVRVYKTSIIKQMKKLYGGQCQLCGCRPFETFDVDICEAHHIDYFSSSKITMQQILLFFVRIIID